MDGDTAELRFLCGNPDVTATSKIPGEVWDLVIDQVGDFATLKACAVSCKAFLRRSRYHLFRRPYLKNFHDAELLVRALRTDAGCVAFVRELLLGFLAATTPTGPVTTHLLPVLSSLEAITIAAEVPLHPLFHTYLPPISHTTTALHLCGCRFDDFLHFGNLLIALPHLEELGLHYVLFTSTDLARSHKDADLTSVRLSRLNFADLGSTQFDASPLAHWLAKTSTPRTLRKLSVMAIFYPAPAIEDLLKLPVHNPCTLVLSRLWKLKTLHLPSVMVQSLKITLSTKQISLVVGLLQSLPHGVLRDVSLRLTTMTFYLKGENSPTPVDWTGFAEGPAIGEPVAGFSEIAALDHVLARPAFSSLQRLNIACVVSIGSQSFTVSSQRCRDQIMTNWLPSLDPRLWTEDFGDVFDFRPVRRSPFIH